MSNPVTVIFNNVEEFVAELREACKDRPRPEVVRVTHRHTQDVDVNDRPLKRAACERKPTSPR